MLSNKTWKIAGAAMLGTAVLLGTNAANARINLDADNESKPAVTYAKELLSKASGQVVEAGGKMYYVVTDTNLNVRSALGFGTTGHVSVTYTFTGAVFSTQVTRAAITAVEMNGATGIMLSSYQVGQMGAKGERVVEFVIVGPDQGLAPTDILSFRLAGGLIAVSADEPVTISVTMTERGVNNPKTNTEDRTGALAVASAVKVTNSPLHLVAESDDDFLTFVPRTTTPIVTGDKGSVGSFTVTEQMTVVMNPKDGTEVEDGDVIAPGVATVNAPANPANSSVIVKGDFSFANFVHFDTSADCANADGDDDLRMLEVSNVRDTTMLRQQDLEYVDSKFLCITLKAAADREALPRKAEYVAEITYAVGEEVPAEADDRVYFPPTDDMATLGSISRGGMSVQLPYLTTNPTFKQRIRVANRGSFDATYSMEFYGGR